MVKTLRFVKMNILLVILLVSFPYCLNGCTGKAVIQSSARNQPEPNAIGYNLPKGLIKLSINEKEGNYEITYTVNFVPDENYLYTLAYLPKATTDDTINITVGANGLLQSITTTTIDRIPEIVQKIAELVPTALKSFIPSAKVSELKLKIKHLDVIFDPDDMEAVKKLQERLLEEQGAIFEVEQLFLEKQNPSEPFASPHSVYYRLLVPYRITLRFTSGDNYFERSEILYIPNRHSPILSLDIRRAAFVTKTHTLTFSNGVLISSAMTKPSEVLGFMSIPLDVAKAIVAVPGSIVKFRIDTTTQSKELVKAQKNLVEAQKELIQEQQGRLEALRKLRETETGTEHDAP
jgi:hypothetical protein